MNIKPITIDNDIWSQIEQQADAQHIPAEERVDLRGTELLVNPDAQIPSDHSFTTTMIRGLGGSKDYAETVAWFLSDMISEPESKANVADGIERLADVPTQAGKSPDVISIVAEFTRDHPSRPIRPETRRTRSDGVPRRFVIEREVLQADGNVQHTRLGLKYSGADGEQEALQKASDLCSELMFGIGVEDHRFFVLEVKS